MSAKPEREWSKGQLDAELSRVDWLAQEIEVLFEGEESSNCVMALAKVFGCCVARFSDDDDKERFKSFARTAMLEMIWEKKRIKSAPVAGEK